MRRHKNKTIHFVAKEAIRISEVLSRYFKVEKETLETLLSIGAIYLNKHRQLTDQKIDKGEHLQVYLEPKRYPVAGIDWKQTILSHEKEFLVINKPVGVPVHSTEDNLIENVLYQLRKFYGEELWVTHRLDTTVSGVMVLAKNQRFQAEFNQILSQRKISKIYRALVEHKPKPGIVKHFMSPEEKSPRKLSLEPQEGWLECLLEIIEVKPWISFEGKEFWDLEIKLHTGRTHQIRAQLSKVGSAILGDKMYRGRNRAGFTTRRLALHATKLDWSHGGRNYMFYSEPNFIQYLNS